MDVIRGAALAKAKNTRQEEAAVAGGGLLSRRKLQIGPLLA